ncbi:Hypothetical_protein [Hexamita inflata]|uniref:Hypothetical_protein n=1 Tax=Hexamita inflata TaxID=28002 RepID=A0AA86UY85_9EUKA|nr:Hypothetical protein HINF_LOCUS56971 [Hexamita inflata]
MDPYIYSQSYYRSCTKQSIFYTSRKYFGFHSSLGVLSTLLARFAQHFERYHRYTKSSPIFNWFVSGSFEQSSNFPIYAFRQVLALSLSNIEAQTEFGQETRYRCQRHGNSTKGLVFFSYDSSSFESMALAIFNNAKISAQSNFDTIIGMRSFQLACNFKVLKMEQTVWRPTLKATSNVFLGCKL